MDDAVRRAFVEAEADYVLPAGFGMFSPEGNARVREALDAFIATAGGEAAGLSGASARQQALYDEAVVSDSGSTFADYFGCEMTDELMRENAEELERMDRTEADHRFAVALDVFTGYAAKRHPGALASKHITALNRSRA